MKKIKAEVKFRREIIEHEEGAIMDSVSLHFQIYRDFFGRERIKPCLWKAVTKTGRTFVSSADSRFIGALEVTPKKEKRRKK